MRCILSRRLSRNRDKERKFKEKCVGYNPNQTLYVCCRIHPATVCVCVLEGGLCPGSKQK